MGTPSKRSPARVRRQSDRGRRAEHPGDVPATGWWAILQRVVRELGEDRADLLAAGVAFYGLLSLVPLLAAGVSLFALAWDPEQVTRHAETWSFIPPAARELVVHQVERVAATSTRRLNLSLIGSLAVALWSGNRAALALLSACSAAYDEPPRGWLSARLQSLLFTAGAVVFLLISLAALVVLPAAFAALDLHGLWATSVWILRWPVLVIMMLVALAVIYRHGPNRSAPRWRWVTPGSVVATAVWLVASGGLTVYASRFSDFNRTYGSLGAVALLLLWLWASAYAVLLGAELNAELEHETLEDTTQPPDQPLGERGAFVADTYAE